jgi:uncharacterized repeat protein (TIGR01451 family)
MSLTPMTHSPRTRGLRRRMLGAALVFGLAVSALSADVLFSAATARADVTTNANDNLRTGWYPNQPSLSPAAVAADDFGQLSSMPVTGQVYAQPVVANGVLLVATEHNEVDGFNPATGERLWTSNLGATFDARQLNGCADISPEVGVTSTPVVDSSTGTAYVMSKAYPTGSTTVGWYLHALDMTTGAEKPNFPVQIQGNADNDPSVPFSARTELQRPGLLLMNGVVYAGFSGHCDAKPFQGWIVGVSTSSAAITAMWTDEAGPNADPTDGPGGGIWMSGAGLVSDASGDIVVTTGNGTPPPNGVGTDIPGTLGQSLVRLRVQPDGTLRAVDHFAPYDASVLNETDSDVGSGGPVALPPQYFGTSAHPRLIVSIGKQGYIWLTDATDLGGVAQGPLGSDKVLARVGPLNGGVRGKPGVWGGDGGYVYIATSQSGAGTGRLSAYKYGVDGSGNPTLAFAGQASDLFGFGSGAPVVTSDGTTSGSALVWTVWFAPSGGGVGAQLRAYDAVPVNGQMVLRKSFPLGTGTKFSVPAVDHGRLYVGAADGHVLAFGSPVQAPLSGSTVSFPRTTVGSSTTATATVTAGSSLTVRGVTSNSGAFHVVSTTPALPANLAAGDSLQVSVNFVPTIAGQVAGTLAFDTTAGPAALSMSGTGQSPGPQLSQFPCCLSFGGLVANGATASNTVTFGNAGAAPLTIYGYQMPSAPYIVTGLPPAGSTLASGASVTATFTFAPTDIGLFTDEFKINTNDPTAIGDNGAAGGVSLSGSGGTPPVMRLTPQDLNYGDVPIGTTATHSFSVTNTGGTDLHITISKVPDSNGFAARTELAEGAVVAAGQTVTERVDFSPTATGTQTATWAITGDDGGGRQDVTFHGVGVAAAPPTVSIADLDINRPTTGTTIANVPVTLSRSSTSPVTMTYATKDGTATGGGGDYVATSGALTFAPGETTKTIPVTINGAQPTPTAETLTVNIANVSGASIADGSSKLYLTTTYLPVSVSVDDVAASAAIDGSATSLAFPVTVNPAPYPGQPVTVNVATADGTAVAAHGDFTPVSTSLTFTSDTPTQTVTVPMLSAPASGTSKTVLLSLSNPSTGSNLADATATGTVYNGTTAPLPALYVSDAAVVRPASGTVGATFTIRLSRPTTNTQVPFSYSAGAGSGLTAADFDVTQGNLTFLPGETTKTVTVPIHGSATSTGTGTVNLNLSKQSGATLGDPGGKAYVVSPLAHAFTSVRPATAWRSPYEDTTVNVPVTLDAPARVPVSVTATTLDGTAIAGTDYATTSTTLTFAPGDTSAILPVTVLHQAAVQATKTFTIKLSGASGTTQLSSSSAAVTIVSHTADTTVPSQQSAPSFTASTPTDSAMVGAPYDYTFAASGIPDPSFAVDNGRLPAGLTLDPLTGRLSGTPTTTGTFTFTISANNTVGSPATTPSLTITVAPPATPAAFTAASPPSPVTEGGAYSYAFAASGNPAPTFAVASGELPPGLGLDPTSGVLAGAPSTPGTYTFTVSAANGIGAPDVTGSLSVVVNPAPVAPQFTAASPNPNATVGAGYDYTFAASGNPNSTFDLASGALPGGLSLDANTGTLSGIPTTAGSFTFQVRASNGVGSPAVTDPITIAVSAAPASPVFTASSPGPNAVVGTQYDYTFAASGNPQPTFAVASGALPPGLTLTAGGGLTGVPTQAGTYTFAVRASNSQGTATTDQLTITVNPQPAPPVFTASSPPSAATVGSAFSYTFAATGNPAPSYAVTADSSLPPGIGLNSASGELSGTPTAAGVFSFTVQASNGIDPAATQAVTITVSEATAPPTFTASDPPSTATVGDTYSYVFGASGTPAPTYAIASGTIPPGLSLSTSGVLSGSLTTAGTFTFAVTAGNSAGTATTGPITVTVAPPPAPATFTANSPTAKATVAVPYSYTFAASGNPSPTFSVSSGTLPAGLALDPASGTLAGTPTAAGTSTFTVTASNGVGTPATTGLLTIKVAAPGIADLAVTVTGPTSTVKLGGTITYNLNISNLGPSTAVQVIGTLTLPAGTTFVSASPSVAVVNGQVTWTQPTLSKGSAVHWKLTVRPATVGSYVASGTASATSTDPNAANNSASSPAVPVK